MSEPAAAPAELKVHAAIVSVMRAVDHVRKQRSEGLSYSFRGIDAVVNAVAPAFRAAGVFILPDVLNYDYQTVKSNANKDLASVRLTVRFVFVGPMGDTLAATVVGEAFDSGDKATAKAMSVALRTCLLQVLALPTDEPDPDTQVYDRGGEQERDLGRWTGEVAAAGRDRAKLKALWDRMLAEWDNVPWSPDRQAIIETAVKASSEPAEPAPAGREGDQPLTAPADEPAIDDPATLFVMDLEQAEREGDLATLRKMVKQAAEMRNSELRKMAAQVLAEATARAGKS